MIRYEESTLKVLDTLGKCQYQPSSIMLEKRCFSKFRNYMEDSGGTTFSLEMAQSCCESNIPASNKKCFMMAMLRLSDVYNHGHVLSAHLKIHGELSPAFSETVKAYLDSISSCGFLDSSLQRYEEACDRFFRFCQMEGIYSVEDIGYPILEKYHGFVMESEGSLKAHEGCIERMLMFLAENGKCRVGYSLYLHYARFEKSTCMTNLPTDSRKAAEFLRENCGSFSGITFYRQIQSLTEQMAASGYCSNITHASEYYLRVLCIFLDREDIAYERGIANIWADSLGGKLFGKSKVNNLKRTLDLFDDFISIGKIIPENIRRSVAASYTELPQWCQEALDTFAQTRLREGIKPDTIKKQLYSCTKFCRFILGDGLNAFSELKPEHIKKFTILDSHESAAGKLNASLASRRFLIYLEFQGIARKDIHCAVATCCMKKETVIRVLGDEDRNRINQYCSDAETPVELRDAAILRLGMSTALRGSDIVSMKFSDIDWKARCIRLIQKKTGVEHTHPVDTAALNALFRYLRDGRCKKASTDHVFVSVVAPYGPVTSEVCRGALIRAGTSAKDFHCIRRRYATDSMKAGATFSETAELLGHTTTETASRYALLDEEKMRPCPLSLHETGLLLEGRYGHAE